MKHHKEDSNLEIISSNIFLCKNLIPILLTSY